MYLLKDYKSIDLRVLRKGFVELYDKESYNFVKSYKGKPENI